MIVKVFFLALLLGVVSVHAQEFVVPEGSRRDVVSETVIETGPTIEGIVKEIFVTRKPWQMINPAAPARYGSGERVLSRDFGPGTPYHSSTVTVFSVEW